MRTTDERLNMYQLLSSADTINEAAHICSDVSSILKPGFTLEEAFDTMCTNQIFIEPPEVSQITVEDSGDEGESMLANLSGQQLVAKAEIKLSNSQRITLIKMVQKKIEIIGN
ncbi:hypothetical protein ILUMI_02841 [Ignelater luminosus]|uniref:Uncharacterized protein n=1 Tax=Ignelater luminosus TaxID=2038154 RepID=A0A8K0GG37_IGNLU|nr:hypothetical protein ILUMI_02841 [Ignelater luminosus]